MVKSVAIFVLMILLWRSCGAQHHFCLTKSRGCAVPMPQRRGIIECASSCSQQSSCIGVSLGSEESCRQHLLSCPAEVLHNDGDSTGTFMSKDCKTYDTDAPIHSNSNDGYETCHDLLKEKKTGKFYIRINLGLQNVAPFNVTCDIRKTSSRTILFESQGLNSFNRTWEEYEQGFYVDQKNSWVGLENWHHVTQAGFNVMSLRAIFYTPNYLSFEWMQTGFIVRDKQNGYSFTFDKEVKKMISARKAPKYNNEIGECMSLFKNRPFSTWDRDADVNENKTCALQAGSGWWYGGCTNNCNVLGLRDSSGQMLTQSQRLSLAKVDLATLMPSFHHVMMFFEETH